VNERGEERFFESTFSNNNNLFVTFDNVVRATFNERLWFVREPCKRPSTISSPCKRTNGFSIERGRLRDDRNDVIITTARRRQSYL